MNNVVCRLVDPSDVHGGGERKIPKPGEKKIRMDPDLEN